MQLTQHLVGVFDKLQGMMGNHNIHTIALQRYFTALANQTGAFSAFMTGRNTVIDPAVAEQWLCGKRTDLQNMIPKSVVQLRLQGLPYLMQQVLAALGAIPGFQFCQNIVKLRTHGAGPTSFIAFAPWYCISRHLKRYPMLSIHAVPAFNDNYIWLISTEGSNQAFVVDPGDPAVVEQALQARELTLAGILITHHHFDHVGGLADLKARYTATVYGPDNPAIEGLDHIVRDGDEVDVLGARLSVIEVPGHTLDHIAYFMSGDEPLVFCGDTLFAGGCGRVFEGTPEMMYQSLTALAELPAETRIYCAHEYTLANLEFAQAVEPNNDSLARRVIADQASRADYFQHAGPSRPQAGWHGQV